MKPDATQHDPTPEYMRYLVERTGLSQREVAKRIGIDDRSIRYYLSHGENRRVAPYPVQFALECLADDGT